MAEQRAIAPVNGAGSKQDARWIDRRPRMFGAVTIRVNRQLALLKSAAISRKFRAGALLAVATFLATGCARGPRLLSRSEHGPIDRSLAEYPTGYTLQRHISNLTAPTAIAFDSDGSLLIAQGVRDEEPQIFGWHRDGSYFQVYPRGRRLPFGLPTPGNSFRLYGPIGGMVWYQGQLYVSHRDVYGRGVITALDYSGGHTTIVADLPAQGDFGVTDLVISPNGRLYFGVGTATNSGVVGLDNWKVGWVKDHPTFHDQPWHEVYLLGYRFDSPNPIAGLFGPSELAVTAPYQAFNTSNQIHVRGVDKTTGKPSGAIYWVSPQGGPVTIEAHGIHYPRGLVFNEFGRLYFTNDGKEMRGTRPIKDDPDALLRLVPGGTWYGGPDYSADLQPITDPRFQPPAEMISRTGYPEVRNLIDQETSRLLPPNRDTLLQGAFPSLSGAAKMDIAPSSGAFKEFRGSVIVSLSGDRAPWATSGQKLLGPVGYKVVRVDLNSHQIKDFVRNTDGGPRSRLSKDNYNLLERPCDVKFGPDGAMYILDYGQMEMRDGKERVETATGQVFRLAPITTPPSDTQPAETAPTP